ncbi:uncharacterized protein LOC131845755, partial [Achroia grisella]|uniref:uncharacterized protein LOC131845755 n=1 Tax=Achroia grisella TaxID=688607 RepID=UPI0027D23C86
RYIKIYMIMYCSPFLHWLLLLGLILPASVAEPIYHDGEYHPLAAVSELTSRLASHSQHLQPVQEARLPLPTPQDLETIKKVAQILVMLGEQVIPAIIGEKPSSNNNDVSEDSVNESSQ